MTLQSGRYPASKGPAAQVVARFALDAARFSVLIGSVSAAVLVGASIVVLRLGPSRPDAAGWALSVIAFTVLAASVAIPVGVAAGPALALQWWVASGAWDGARLAGIRGMTLAFPALLIGSVAVPLFVLEHRLVPESRSWLETAPLGRFGIVPGRALPTPLGDAVGLPAATLILGRDRSLLADRFEPARRAGVPAVVLHGVKARIQDTAITADQLVLSAALPGSLGARSDAALAASPGGYAAAILAKRTFHPLTAMLLGAALLPLGVSRRPWAGIAVLALSVLVVIRLGDALSWHIGAAAAAIEPAWVVAVGAFLWIRWRDR